MKTPEELAYEYGEKFDGAEISKNDINIAWYEGYKEAQKDTAIEIEQLKGSIEALRTIGELWQEDLKASREQMVFWKLKALE